MHDANSPLRPFALIKPWLRLALRRGLQLTALGLLATAVAAASDEAGRSTADAAAAVTAMKTAPRGPFKRIRWFCKDGQRLPPTPSACVEFGGGSQHGEWSAATLALRDAGYRIANVYSDMDPAELFEHDPFGDVLAQMLVEQYLIRVDDGWILRRARYYRGALQEEGERAGKRRLLEGMTGRSEWLDRRYLRVRTAARLWAHGRDVGAVQKARQLAASIAERYPGFTATKNKIHILPDAGDAAAVRTFAAALDDEARAEIGEDLVRLAGLIDEVYSDPGSAVLDDILRAAEGAPPLNAAVKAARPAFRSGAPALERYQATSRLLAALRTHATAPPNARSRLALIDASLEVEDQQFAAASALTQELPTLDRRAHLAVAGDAIAASYGSGLISARQRAAADDAIAALDDAAVEVAAYKQTVDYLGLVPGWGSQQLQLAFGDGMDKLTAIEPRAALFIQDQLRGSPLFFFATLLERLARDANQLAGVRHELLGKEIGTGLRALNPGLARGTLRLRPPAASEADSKGIYLLPETVADLPPVAGILTRGEGNPLSHVQLLARNLGIPNVAIDAAVVERLAPHDGATVVLAVSPAGSVRLVSDDGTLDYLFDAPQNDPLDSLIEVNVDKLELDRRELLTLSQLRAEDSGRVVGPKAAKLGELKHHYPQAVAEGLAIPFGVFRDLLRQPFEDAGLSTFEWMQREYARLAGITDPAERRTQTEAFRARLERWVLAADPGPAFRQRLRARMHEIFGPDGTFGVFVRSDTNVEDLPGFTGAGLNLTVPNVVGDAAILAAVPRVWASPFSARSFAWRQSLMDKPEHVYPAVLLMLSVNADKSGVMVTRDIDSGSDEWLSVAVNEGVGGAVDGQSAESLRIRLADGEVRLLAQATAPYRRQVALDGGVSKLPVTLSDRVLKPAEIDQLIALARDLPERFPPILDAAGEAAPADIEFGFVDGELKLFQIRPFLDSTEARGSAYLSALDEPLAARATDPVALDAPLTSE